VLSTTLNAKAAIFPSCALPVENSPSAAKYIQANHTPQAEGLSTANLLEDVPPFASRASAQMVKRYKPGDHLNNHIE